MVVMISTRKVRLTHIFLQIFRVERRRAVREDRLVGVLGKWVMQNADRRIHGCRCIYYIMYTYILDMTVLHQATVYLTRNPRQAPGQFHCNVKCAYKSGSSALMRCDATRQYRNPPSTYHNLDTKTSSIRQRARVAWDWRVAFSRPTYRA
jgi:hypothetical protein